MELVTGRKGSAHITSQQDRMKHQGTWGSGAYILQTGQMLEPQVQSSNEIRIRDGALMVQGALGCVKVNTYDPVTIQNGTQGMKRIDLICWQYTYDAEQDVESAEWVVIQGTPAESDPQQPAYTDGDIQQGDSPVQVPVFAVELDGINVTGVTTLLPTAPTLEELNSKMLVNQPVSARSVNPSQIAVLTEQQISLDHPALVVVQGLVEYSNVTYDSGQRQCRLTVDGTAQVWHFHNIQDIDIYARGVYMAYLSAGQHTISLGAYFSSTTGNSVTVSGRLTVAKL